MDRKLIEYVNEMVAIEKSVYTQNKLIEKMDNKVFYQFCC